MSTLGTALKATGLTLLLTSSVAIGGIGYGGYKLSKSVSSIIDSVNCEIKQGTLTEGVNGVLESSKGTIESIRKKVDALGPDEVKQLVGAVTDLANMLSGKDVVDENGKSVQPGLIMKALRALLGG